MKNELQKSEKPVFKRFSKKEFSDIIERFNGLTFDICREIQCSPRQFWITVERYGLRELVAESRKNLVSEAESELRFQLRSGDDETRLKAATFILERLGKTEGWSKNPDVQQQINVQGDCDIKSLFGLQ